MLSIGSVVLTVEDITRAGDFWRAALGYVDRRPPSEDWVILDPPYKERWDAPGRASRCRSPATRRATRPASISTCTPRIRRPRSHGSSSSARATVDWDGYPDDADWVVLEDTEGNRFCVVDTGPQAAA